MTPPPSPAGLKISNTVGCVPTLFNLTVGLGHWVWGVSGSKVNLGSWLIRRTVI